MKRTGNSAVRSIKGAPWRFYPGGHEITLEATSETKGPTNEPTPTGPPDEIALALWAKRIVQAGS